MSPTRRRASSLGNDQKPPDRAAGLADDWGPPPVTATLPVMEPIPVPALEPVPEQRQTRRASPSRRPRIISGRVPEALFKRINEARNGTDLTHEQWFAIALDAVYDDLIAHYRELNTPKTRVPIPQRRSRRPGAESMTQYPLRLSPEAAKVLNEVREECRPPSLSEFLTTIVRMRLDQLDLP